MEERRLKFFRAIGRVVNCPPGPSALIDIDTGSAAHSGLEGCGF